MEHTSDWTSVTMDIPVKKISHFRREGRYGQIFIYLKTGLYWRIGTDEDEFPPDIANRTDPTMGYECWTFTEDPDQQYLEPSLKAAGVKAGILHRERDTHEVCREYEKCCLHPWEDKTVSVLM